MSTVFANGPGDQGSISGRVIPKTQKMVLDAALLNTQNYEVRIKGKVEQSRERSIALPYTSGKGSIRVIYIYIYMIFKHIPFLRTVKFYNISTLVGYLVWFILVWFGFIVYQPL